VTLAHATVRAENNFKHMMLAEQEDFFRRGARAFYQQGLYQQAKMSWSRILLIRADDHEALEGFARAEEALLRAAGKGRDDKAHDLLEEGLEFYATQDWRRALDTFQRLAQISPDYEAISNEYATRIKARLSSGDYSPQPAAGKGWKPDRPSNQSGTVVEIPEKLENFVDRIKGLEAQLSREPGNINLQQQLDQVRKAQEDESKRIYKDGLIAYSQGNRDLAMQQWKQVLVINPEHKKAAAALRKAKAEEDRKE
jgi:tetratricopeptide (TPR) repeat protein